MESHKNAEKSTQSSFGQTRKTLLFNERTDRSLSTELSQLERSQKKVRQDLRKIHQVQELVKTHLMSSSEFDSRHRSRSDSSINFNAGKVLPQLSKRKNTVNNDNATTTSSDFRRPRFNSESVVSSVRKTSVNFMGQHVDAESFSNQDVEEEDGRDRPSPKSYRTNQERREDLMIMSRFHQLGSKFVGRDMLEKRQKRMSDKYQKQKGIIGLKKFQPEDRERIDENSPDKSTSEVVFCEDDTNASTELPTNMASMNIAIPQPKARFSDNSSSASPKSCSSFEDNYLPNKLYLSKADTYRDNPPPKLFKKSSNNSMAVSSNGAMQRKISSISIHSHDLDLMRPRNDVSLPRIQIESTPGIACNGNSKHRIAHAFRTCQQVNPDDKELRSERKRRFANLVNAVIKQGKVINAWEPLLNKIGDIHSVDEEVHL